MFIVAEIILK